MLCQKEVELSELTGLGPLELAVLESMELLGATPELPHVKMPQDR
jgi:hypothetical protein